jgi:hypothetical protein
MPRSRLLPVGAAAVLVLCGCSPLPGGAEPALLLPPTGAAFDYQLGGAYDPPAGVGIVVRDSTDEPADGLYNVCYINGFQTQPGQADFWLDEHPGLVLRDDDGDPIVDPGWPDEYLLDTSRSTGRDEIADILNRVIAGCSRDGFDAVEFDNLDSWTRSDGALTLDDNLALARTLVSSAHGLGLAAAQKNGAEESGRLRDGAALDFAITEDCALFDECDAYSGTYGDLVFDIEYDADQLAAACRSVGSAILRDLQLAPAGAPGYVWEGC